MEKEHSKFSVYKRLVINYSVSPAIGLILFAASVCV